MANQNLTTEQTQFILNRAKNATYNTLDVTPMVEASAGVLAPLGYQASMPSKIINSDSTDNSLSTGGQIGQKVMIVGDGNKYVQGISSEGFSLSGVPPVFTGYKDGSGNSLGDTGTTKGRNTVVAAATSVNDANNHTAALLGAGASFTGAWTNVIGKYSAVAVMAYVGVAGWTTGTLNIQWSSDGVNFDGGYDYLAMTAGTDPGQMTVPVRNNYVRVKFTNGSTDMAGGGNTFDLTTILHPSMSGSVVQGSGVFFAAGDGSGVPMSPLTLGLVDSSTGTTLGTFGGSAGANSTLSANVVFPSAQQVVGNIANNGVDSGNPIKTGRVANSSVPTAVTTTRRVADWADLNGRSQVSLGDPGVSLLASAARTTTQTSADLTNATCKGIIVVLDMTTVGTGSVTLAINFKDPASGKYIALLTGAAVTTNSTNVYRIYPGLTAAANATASDILPRTFQIVVTANNANSATYSVGYNLIP